MIPKKLITVVLSVWITTCIAQAPKIILPMGHSSSVSNVAVTKDGSRLVTTSWDNTAKMWDVHTGRLLTTFTEHKGFVESAQFNRDETKLLTNSDGMIVLWDVKTGKMLHKFELGDINYVITYSGFVNNDKEILTLAEDLTVTRWSVLSGEKIEEIELGDGEMEAVSYSREFNKVVGSDDDGNFKIWNLSDKSEMSFETDAGYDQSHTDVVFEATFSRDGRILMTMSDDGSLMGWDAKTGQHLYTHHGFEYEDYHIVLSKDGTRFYHGGERIVCRDIKTGRIITQLKGSNESYDDIRISEDEKQLLATCPNHTAVLWDLSAQKQLQTFKGHRDFLFFAEFLPQKDLLVTGSADNDAIIWNINDGSPYQYLNGKSEVLIKSASHAETQMIAVAREDGKIELWDMNTAKIERIIDLGKLQIEDLSFNKDGTKLIVDTEIEDYVESNIGHIIHVKTGKILPLISHTNDLNTLAFNPSGTKVITTSNDGTVKVWDAENGNLMKTLSSFTGKTWQAVYSHNGKHFATRSENEGILLWDAQSYTIKQRLKNGTSSFSSFNFSPDDTKIVAASSGKDSTVCAWDTETGKLRYQLEGHPYVNSVQYLADNETLLIDWSMKLAMAVWSPTTGYSYLKGFKGFKRDVSFSSNGKYLKVASGTAVKVWQTSDWKLIGDFSHSKEVLSVSFFGDNTKLVATSANNETSIWDLNTKTSASFFSIKNNPFIILSNGYYTGNKEVAKNLHFVTKNLDVITFEQLDVRYNRPDKVYQHLNIPNKNLIKAYRQAYEKRINNLNISDQALTGEISIPELKITNRNSIAYNQMAKQITLNISAQDPSHGLVSYSVWVNGVPEYGKQGKKLDGKKTHNATIKIELSTGRNIIEASVTNSLGIESYRKPLNINCTAQNQSEPNFYFLGIGIDEFYEPNHNLSYSVKDIQDLAQAFRAKYGANAIIDTLFNKNVNKKNIVKLKETLKNTKVDDIVVVAYSGHGLLSENLDYYLSTYEVNFDDPSENGLPYADFQNLVNNILSRKKLVLVDACHSGEIDKDERTQISKETKKSGLSDGSKGSIVLYQKPKIGIQNSFELMQDLFVNLKKGSGSTVISAASGTQFAFEMGDLKNGVFTYSILSQFRNNASISVQQLKTNVGKMVFELTGGLQKPTSRLDNTTLDWDVWR